MQEIQTDVVIIGAGLTGLTLAFRLTEQGKKVRILEKNDWIGGQIRTFEEDEFVFESGPNTGVVSYPEVAELFSALSPGCELETADENAARRLIWKNGRFRELPSGIIGGITTPLFTFPDKFRVLGEPFRRKGTDPNESVGALALRRLGGKSFVDYAVDPFLSGVYSGDPMTLVTRYALPKLYNLEQTYGGFIKGSIAKMREPKTERDRLATKKVFSARGGLSRLASALANAIGKEHIVLSTKEIQIRPVAARWEVTCTAPTGEEKLQTTKIVTTVGSYALPDLLPFIEKDAMNKISNLRYAPMIQASVGIKNTGGLRFNAFGGLVPSVEKQDVLGILFPSACFQGRAPQAGALFSFFIGGIRSVPLTQLTDDELKELIVKNFHSMLKFPSTVSPDLIRIFRHPKAIPQYEQSTGDRLKAIETIQNRYPGLILAGNIRNGIGMADRILQATNISKEI